eukprot:GHVO01046320.1.p1 GENE.GHVO01046320.1~~GHVO01046320.1.p1  ORF type:complete len:121 (-),score=5.85 GHVO01046320.1:336-698(-)
MQQTYYGRNPIVVSYRICSQTLGGCVLIMTGFKLYVDKIFSMVALDYAVITWKTEEHNLLMMIDHFSRWFEVTITPDQTATSTASAFVTNWISRYGMPLKLLTDRGAPFKSDLCPSYHSS